MWNYLENKVILYAKVASPFNSMNVANSLKKICSKFNHGVQREE